MMDLRNVTTTSILRMDEILLRKHIMIRTKVLTCVYDYFSLIIYLFMNVYDLQIQYQMLHNIRLLTFSIKFEYFIIPICGNNSASEIKQTVIITCKQEPWQ